MTIDRYRPLTAAVLLVAAIAAVVSYMHVATLALAYGQPPLAAYLLPLSIGGLVASSSLVLLRAARAQVSAPWLARTGLVLAVISAETAISMSRRRVASAQRPQQERPAGTQRAPAPAKGGPPGHQRRTPRRPSWPPWPPGQR